MTENEIGTLVVNAAYEVHTRLGPGLLESAYQKCLIYELKNENLDVRSEVHLPLRYKDVKLDCGYRIDIWVNEKIVIEIKTVENLLDIHTAQLLTYLKLTHCRLGYLLNFQTPKIKYGIKRVANNLYERLK
ncbi:GxxExxY protein [Rhodohalobacter sp. 614A]|uniref:GxxExxY protein n=1 Tax=Rhodohalobacter sp. 614A TaxID=2908649 RepID=UPI001F2781AF|nr:GxxExxY protein [Rhodohalobacter sp. 614A]